MADIIKLPWWRVAYLHFLAGTWWTNALRTYIHRGFQARLYNIVLDPFHAQFIQRDDVLTYYREHMPYRWRLVYKLGAVDLGSCTLTEALARVQKTMPKSVVRHIDDVIHSIFIKTIAEGQSE